MNTDVDRCNRSMLALTNSAVHIPGHGICLDNHNPPTNLIFQDLFNFGSPDKHIRVKSVLRSHLRDNEKVVF
jgi:hypothetical protein